MSNLAGEFIYFLLSNCYLYRQAIMLLLLPLNLAPSPVTSQDQLIVSIGSSFFLATDLI